MFVLERFGMRVMRMRTSEMEKLVRQVHVRETFALCLPFADGRFLLENCMNLEKRMTGVQQGSSSWLMISCLLSREAWQEEQVLHELRKQPGS